MSANVGTRGGYGGRLPEDIGLSIRQFASNQFGRYVSSLTVEAQCNIEDPPKVTVHEVVTVQIRRHVIEFVWPKDNRADQGGLNSDHRVARRVHHSAAGACGRSGSVGIALSDRSDRLSALSRLATIVTVVPVRVCPSAASATVVRALRAMVASLARS